MAKYLKNFALAVATIAFFIFARLGWINTWFPENSLLRAIPLLLLILLIWKTIHDYAGSGTSKANNMKHLNLLIVATILCIIICC